MERTRYFPINTSRVWIAELFLTKKYMLEQYDVAQGLEYLLPKQYDVLIPYGASCETHK